LETKQEERETTEIMKDLPGPTAPAASLFPLADTFSRVTRSSDTPLALEADSCLRCLQRIGTQLTVELETAQFLHDFHQQVEERLSIGADQRVHLIEQSLGG